jgi:hypothetical protein
MPTAGKTGRGEQGRGEEGGTAVTPTASQRPLLYPRDAVLTIAQVCDWLGGISVKTFHRWGIKHANGLVRAEWVYQYLEKAAAA